MTSDPANEEEQVVLLNDTSEFRMCFACGQRNPQSLKLDYEMRAGRIVTRFTPGELHQGFPGVIHGGIIATALDETLSRACIPHQPWVMTGKMEIKYRSIALLGSTLEVSSWVTRVRSRAIETAGEVRLLDGTLVAEGTALFLHMPQALRAHLETQYPGIKHLFGS